MASQCSRCGGRCRECIRPGRRMWPWRIALAVAVALTVWFLLAFPAEWIR